MMRLAAIHRASLLGSLLLMAACSSGSPTQDLNARLQMQLAPQIATNEAALQPLPDGSQVLLIDESLFAAGGAQLNDKGQYILASVIEGLIDPRLLRIEVADSPGTAAYLQSARVQAVTEYFADYGLAPTLQPPSAPVATTSPGTVIAIHVAAN
jgi:hypothetical protein